jgi:hypothetical protein
MLVVGQRAPTVRSRETTIAQSAVGESSPSTNICASDISDHVQLQLQLRLPFAVAVTRRIEWPEYL